MSKHTGARVSPPRLERCTYCREAAVHSLRITDSGTETTVGICDAHAPFGWAFSRVRMGLASGAQAFIVTLQPDLLGGLL